MKIYFILSLFFLSCSNKSDGNNSQQTSKMMQAKLNNNFDTINIEKNFEIRNFTDFQKPINNSDNLIPYEVVSNTFLNPVNETIYGKSYLKSKYYIGYRFKLTEKIWILSYKHHYDLHGEDLIWSIYNIETKQLLSKISVNSIDVNFNRSLKNFDGKKISITTIYNRHFENGMEGDNSDPVELEEAFGINENYRFYKIK
ncbi:hypothetical protein [Chryseobacterium binzhouense]|uniref:hypothetical protein n=1 Tax=Chryseobacterium binzhouense TaxID=2593646 RepID=UPI00289E96C4|nr:hypothetical protein [Chryseobacterium binzhouense]